MRTPSQAIPAAATTARMPTAIGCCHTPRCAGGGAASWITPIPIAASTTIGAAAASGANAGQRAPVSTAMASISTAPMIGAPTVRNATRHPVAAATGARITSATRPIAAITS